jgi:chaperone required for assembly of F1-ATPase
VTGWPRRRFWAEPRAAPGAGGWEVRLDGRPVRTPARAVMSLPTQALAEAVAAEWAAQGETVDPRTMPLTRAANAAIDRVAREMQAVADALAAYAQTDLICHRAASPAGLAAAQAAAWDPYLAWAEAELGSPLAVTAGVIAVPQPEPSLMRLRAEVGRFDPFALTALHELVTLTGSLILGLAAARGRAPGPEIWAASRVDEDWQERLWGRDAEAAEAARLRREAFLSALRFHRLSRPEARDPD